MEYPGNYANLERRLQSQWTLTAEMPNTRLEQQRKKWHDTLADPTRDCAPKILARAAGVSVKCICGCGQWFSAEVRG
jgi:hypothetical protein